MAAVSFNIFVLSLFHYSPTGNFPTGKDINETISGQCSITILPYIMRKSKHFPMISKTEIKHWSKIS